MTAPTGSIAYPGQGVEASALTELAVRCECAEGPDRALDVAIGLAGKFYVAEPRYLGAEPMIGYVDDDGSRVEPGNGAQDGLVPPYTASLDAAMTLVPTDGSMNFVEFSWSWEPQEPEVWPAASVRWYPPHKSGPDWHAFVVSARTPALTLCAAALRARAAPNLAGSSEARSQGVS
jgi:hypothetical protein